MSNSFGNNIASIKAQRQLNAASDALGRSMERLSSGMRINRPSDDAAGQAISSTLNARNRQFGQSIRNVNDAISFANIREGATQELTGVVTRIRELATQAASGSYSQRQRTAIDTEAQALRSEFNRIVESTTFNGLRAFADSGDNIRIQAGYTDDSSALYLGDRNLGTNTTNSGTFNAVSSFGVAGTPRSIFAGDINDDGINDLAINGIVVGFIELRIGNGDGTFQTTTSLSVGANTFTVLNDVNGDGKLDATSIANIGGNMITHLGNGDGTFGGSITHNLGVGNVNGVALNTLDVNGDGKSDLVLTPAAGGSIRYWQGNGDGTYASGVTIHNFGSAGALADVNGDGKLDLIAGATTSIVARLGNGDGTFGSSITYTTGAASNEVFAVGDFNGDGILDAVVDINSADQVLLFGNGNGTFRMGATVNQGFNPDRAQAADLNGDGMADLVTTNYIGGTVGYSFGNGDGTFSAYTSVNLGVGVTSLRLTDINRDGALDFLATGEIGQRVSIMTGQTKEVSKLNAFSLTSRREALAAIYQLDRVGQNIALSSSEIGASRSRLESATRTLGSTRESYSAASSRISDVDVAQEAAEMVRQQILQQSGTAILAQANQLPALLIDLLKR